MDHWGWVATCNPWVRTRCAQSLLCGSTGWLGRPQTYAHGPCPRMFGSAPSSMRTFGANMWRQYQRSRRRWHQRSQIRYLLSAVACSRDIAVAPAPATQFLSRRGVHRTSSRSVLRCSCASRGVLRTSSVLYCSHPLCLTLLLRPWMFTLNLCLHPSWSTSRLRQRCTQHLRPECLGLCTLSLRSHALHLHLSLGTTRLRQLGTQYQHLSLRTSIHLPMCGPLLPRPWMSTWRLRHRCTLYLHQLLNTLLWAQHQHPSLWT